MSATLTNDIYWASQPPAVQALRTMAPGGSLENAAVLLAQQGYDIDIPIMVWQWDAVKVMQLRKDYGYTWVPSALMAPVALAPGLTVPGEAPYDPLHPPAGAIRVSVDAADYPPFIKPAIAVPAGVASLVGQAQIGGTWTAISGASAVLANGQSYNDPLGRGNFTFHAVETFAGLEVWFTQG